ncbi:microsomal glutathione S-transferase 3 [Folsomia candida]|uniref:Glutathione S-transferase 3, mitochondrial n=1 Tax=Folsomia candida TaxID=158441 RepID=A0A226D3E0_FOLCA|nr:microsomal glutathione S-transferase 3 [Folsomia candida]OXA39181.1 Microsomal glutathione S-transferase 3 [Folsomia candida]
MSSSCSVSPAAATAATTTASVVSKPVVKLGKGSVSRAIAGTAALSGATLKTILPSGYGFVVLTAIGSVMLLTWKSIKVGIAREEYKVPYPQMYSQENMAFNCVQRAHQNTLENYPQFLLTLMIGGLEMPYFCTVGGCIWIMGRICYARGYYTGDPYKRSRGSFSMFGMVMCLAATTRFALKHLGWSG